MHLKKLSINKIPFLILILILFCLIALSIGPTKIDIFTTCKILLSQIPGWEQLLPENVKESQITIILKIRLPRIILAALVGMALATVGASFQGIFKNPMADPYIIGISSGAALGAAIAIVTNLSFILGSLATSLMAFLTGLLSIFVVYNLARDGNRVPIHNLLLAGVALSAFMSAMMSLLMVINSKEMSQIVFWLLGSFSLSNWSQVLVATPIILSGIVGLIFFARELNLMIFGENTAQHLGVNTEQTKIIILIIGTLTVATAVSISGKIGFVGLIVPHTIRLLVGPNHKILLPVSAIAGGIFMVLTDTIARSLLNGTEIPVGIITALCGAPFFIYLLKKRKMIS